MREDIQVRGGTRGICSVYGTRLLRELSYHLSMKESRNDLRFFLLRPFPNKSPIFLPLSYRFFFAFSLCLLPRSRIALSTKVQIQRASVPTEPENFTVTPGPVSL